MQLQLLFLAPSTGGLGTGRHRRLRCRASQQARVPAVRVARIFWDLDNINARSPEHALVVGHRLKLTVQRLTGLPPALSAFANEHTVSRLCQRGTSESWAAVVEMLQADLVVAGLEKDAADLLMRREMVDFAEEHGTSGAIACVSNDQGFAPALERCSHMGAFTVAVGTYLRTAGYNWSQRPSKLPVPSVANCIVAWHPGRAKQHSAAELRLLADWQQRTGEEVVTGAERRYKGVCMTRWLNPDRRPQQELLLAGNASGDGGVL